MDEIKWIPGEGRAMNISSDSGKISTLPPPPDIDLPTNAPGQVIRPVFQKYNKPEDEMVAAIRHAIMQFEGRVTMASTLGCIEIAKQAILMDLFK